MESCIYVGSLRHRRRAPVDHSFEYPLFMMYLDLDELPRVFDRNPLWSAKLPTLAWFRRADHLGAADMPLAEAVRDLVESRLHRRVEGPIRLLTHLRYFGYGFNPVSFYYCYDAAGENVEAIVAEINNTPWGEQHCYVVEGLRRDAFEKEFHVSPFMSMQQRYNWRFSAPTKTLAVHMENHDRAGKVFDATLRLRREPITARSLNSKLVTYPLMTAQVIARIYWQAFKLWWRKCPYVPHPSSSARSLTDGADPR